MIGFTPGRGWYYALHPLTKLLLAACLTISAIVVPGHLGAVGALGAALLLALVGRVPGALRPTLVLSAPIWLFLLAIHWGIRGDPVVAISIGSRITAVVAVFMTAMMSIHPGKLVEGLVSVGAPFGLAYVVSATFQAIPRLQQHADAVLEAQRCRGIRVRDSWAGRTRAMIPLVMPLVLGALTEVDDRAVALETRGAAAGARRTPLNPPEYRWLDSLVLVTGAAAVVASVFLRF